MAADRDCLGQALAYAAADWPVFPCKPGFKVPAFPSAHAPGGTCTGECGREGHGFHDATTDQARISDWWRRYPSANVAIRTGSPGPDVLDVDTGPAGSGWAAFGRLKRAGLLTGASAIVRTRSGGAHIYFAGTGQPCGRLPRHFLDFKAAGGYVLAPPSFVAADDKPAGAYELVDHRAGTARLDWQAVRRLLDPPAHQPAASAGAPGTLTQRAREGIRRAVADANANGGWAGILFWAGCRYAEKGAPLDEALAELVAAASPWNSHEERRAVTHIASGWRKAAGEARKAAR
jgi:hypothetical protein